MSTQAVDVVLAKGDGIGPEISNSVVEILDAAGAQVNWHEVLLGESAADAGHADGIEPGAVEQMQGHGIVLKAPMATPSGGGITSINVRLRQALGMWANVRPVSSYPMIQSPRGELDLTVFRENTEDSYVGLTHELDQETIDFLTGKFGERFSGLGYEADGSASFGIQIVSDKASERIMRAAFEFSRAIGSGQVHAMAKPNILKLTDGRFKARFGDLVVEFEDVNSHFSIIDAGAAWAIAYPQPNDVLVMQNLYGDILSDVFAMQAHGSLGLAPSVNIGGDANDPVAMFEAVHGTAPDIAGQGKANPTALLLSSLMMLRFTGQPDVALRIHNALMRTLEQGKVTGDVKLAADGRRGSENTRTFTDAVINNIGQEPETPYNPGYMTNDLRCILPGVSRG